MSLFTVLGPVWEYITDIINTWVHRKFEFSKLFGSFFKEDLSLHGQMISMVMVTWI